MVKFEIEERFPARKSPRMKHYDYSTPNYYFVTICTNGKRCLFGEPNQLNTLGRIAEDKLRQIDRHFAGVMVDKYVVMPNHIHVILALQQSNAELSAIVGQYKAAVTKQARTIIPDVVVWQGSFHDHVIRNQQAYEKIWLYIEGNPGKWQEDCFYTGGSTTY